MRPEPIDDAADPRIADYRDVTGGARRDGLFVAESRRIVRRLLGATRFRPRSVFTTEAALADLADLLGERVPVYVAPERIIRAVVGYPFHRGCLALGEPATPVREEHLLAGRRLLVLERIGNPDNVGGVFRNAMAFGVDGVLLSPGCGDPLYRRAIRVSTGGTLEVPFAALADWPEGLARLRAAGFTVVALTPDGRLDLAAVDVRGGVALLVGAEGEGISAAARAAADLTVAIPMAGGHSLNVATATGIALHHFARRTGG